MTNNKSFTLVELTITIVILGIIMIPLGIMSIEYMRGMVYSRGLVLAEGLIKTEMAKINNLAYDVVTLANAYDNTASDYGGYRLDMRREVDYVAGTNNELKKVVLTVYKGATTAQLAQVTTYIANVTFGAGSAGGGVVTTGDADSLTVSGGSISDNILEGITLQNTGGSEITITGAIISFSGTTGIKLKSITIETVPRWSGTVSSGQSLEFDPEDVFTLSASTTYTDTCVLTFSTAKVLSEVSSLVFTMSDGSETTPYSCCN